MSKPNTEMEERFKEKFENDSVFLVLRTYHEERQDWDIADKVLDFIRSELASQKKQLVEEIEKVVIGETFAGGTFKENEWQKGYTKGYAEGYREARRKALSLLENK